MRTTAGWLTCVVMGVLFWAGVVPAGGTEAVILCHMASGNPDQARVIRVDEAAAQAHMAHGDVLGGCPGPYRSCGWMVQDPQCMLFKDDADQLFVLNSFGTTQAGDRVLVTGTLDPDCNTFCEQADGCILQNSVASCEESCSPGEGCPSSRTFCLQETGVCDSKGPGICAPVPESCTGFGTPVCGCDGITYGNACFAAMVGVNVFFPGACSQEPCTPRDGCSGGMFCSQPVGVCDPDALGACATPPGDIGCGAVYDPVCSCDGVTYDSCDALALGVNLECFGECPCL